MQKAVRLFLSLNKEHDHFQKALFQIWLLDEQSFLGNFWMLTGSAKALERAAEFCVKPIIKQANDLR